MRAIEEDCCSACYVDAMMRRKLKRLSKNTLETEDLCVVCSNWKGCQRHQWLSEIFKFGTRCSRVCGNLCAITSNTPANYIASKIGGGIELKASVASPDGYLRRLNI